MILKSYRVKEFKSVWDSELIEVDEKITCLVGKNEAGKTALLQALYRSNPIDETDTVFDEVYHYPKSEVSNYQYEVENGERNPVEVVRVDYVLEKKELERVEKIFGPGVIPSKSFSRIALYGQNHRRYSLQVDDEVARKFLSEQSYLSQTLRDELTQAENWKEFFEILNEEEQTEKLEELTTVVKEVAENGLSDYIYKSIIKPLIPKFLYFDEYYQMRGCENLNSLIARKKSGQLLPSDHPLIGLVNIARLNLEELVKSKNTQELKNKLQNAGNC